MSFKLLDKIVSALEPPRKVEPHIPPPKRKLGFDTNSIRSDNAPSDNNANLS